MMSAVEILQPVRSTRAPAIAGALCDRRGLDVAYPEVWMARPRGVVRAIGALGDLLRKKVTVLATLGFIGPYTVVAFNAFTTLLIN